MKKTIVGLIAGMLVMTCFSVYAVVTSFPDVPPEEWFYEDVMTLASWDVIRGYPDGYFRPGDYANRAEVSAIINRYDKHVDDKINEAFTNLNNSEEFIDTFGDAVSGVFADTFNDIQTNLGDLYYAHALGMVDTAAMYYNHAWNESIFKTYVFEISCDKFDPLRNTASTYLNKAKNYIDVSSSEEDDILGQIDSYKTMCEQL